MSRIIKIVLMTLFCTAVSLVYAEEVHATDILAPVDTQDMLTMPAATTDIAVPSAVEIPAVPAANLTYIDISIDNQTLVYYVNGVPVIITPCVTGSPGRGTPRGVFQINSCVPGKYLKGPTWNVWVDRWMRFYGNVGIHDAKWRKNFGGDIYKKNGSHGCVNIPHDQAVLLYGMVGVGTPVIVH